MEEMDKMRGAPHFTKHQKITQFGFWGFNHLLWFLLLNAKPSMLASVETNGSSMNQITVIKKPNGTEKVGIYTSAPYKKDSDPPCTPS